MTKEEAAYLAGIIDGEGSILLVQQSRYGHRLCIYVAVAVTSTDIELLEWCQDRAGGGYIVSKKKQKEEWKDVWLWHIKARKALALLEQVLPYLVINRRRIKAQFMLEHFRNLPKGRLTEEGAIKRARLIDEFRSLD